MTDEQVEMTKEQDGEKKHSIEYLEEEIRRLEDECYALKFENRLLLVQIIKLTGGNVGRLY